MIDEENKTYNGVIFERKDIDFVEDVVLSLKGTDDIVAVYMEQFEHGYVVSRIVLCEDHTVLVYAQKMED